MRSYSEFVQDRKYAALRAASGRLHEHLGRAIAEGRRVSKLGAMADRIASKKTAHDRKADEWARRLDAVDAREPQAFAMGDAAIQEREVDLAELESTVRTLSNLPLVNLAAPSADFGGDETHYPERVDRVKA